MGKRQEAAKVTREKIVQAAKRLLAGREPSSVSVDEIAAEAGVSKGSFYVYFKRKEDVAAEIASRRFDELKKEAAAYPGTATAKLGRFLTESVRYIEEQGLSLCKEWMKGAVCPCCGDSSGQNKLNFDRTFILQLLLSEKEKEREENFPAEALADIIVAEYYGCVALWSMTDGAFPLQKRTEQFVGALDDLLPKYFEHIERC